MKKEDLLLEKLRQYAASDMYPFHMPGHKRNFMNESFLNPFSVDITEIEGFDNLHHPEGILKDSMEWASKIYGSDKSYYLVNGSSCGIMSAVCACVKRGGKILVSRNCHKSVYFGIMLNDMKKTDIYPQVVETMGISGGILSENVDKALQEDPDIEAVLVVSPTYDGIVSDIESIAEITHKYGIPLIVDEAHGAHFSFYHPYEQSFPKSALECGADLVIQSLHKTLPSMTQTSILHARKGLVDFSRLEKYLQMFQSSSPSYVFMASIENCIYQMSVHGENWVNEFAMNLKQLRYSLSDLQNIKILDKTICKKDGVYDLDLSKLVVSVRNCIINESNGEVRSDFSSTDKRFHLPIRDRRKADGKWFADLLRSNYHIEVEMAGADYVLLILTCFDTQEGMKRLVNALVEIDKLLSYDEKYEISDAHIWHKNTKEMELEEASNAEMENVLIAESAGRISGEFVYLYPPGIPIVMPGERISEAAAARIMEYKMKKLPVQGLRDLDAEIIQVVIDRR